MKKLFIVALLVACTAPDVKKPTPVYVGTEASFAFALSAALDCPVPQITFSVIEVGAGTITSDGVYTAPGCAWFATSNDQRTVHIGGAGCGKSAQVPVTLMEKVQTVDVCGVAAGTSCCAPAINTYVGSVNGFYATVHYDCHDEYVPSQPPPLCN